MASHTRPVLSARSCLAQRDARLLLCLLHVRTSAPHGVPTGRPVSRDFLQAASGPHRLIAPPPRPVSVVFRVVVTHLTVKGSEQRKEKASDGDDEVVLDPGNVNIGALHQGLAFAVTRPACSSPPDSGNRTQLKMQERTASK